MFAEQRCHIMSLEISYAIVKLAFWQLFASGRHLETSARNKSGISCCLYIGPILNIKVSEDLGPRYLAISTVMSKKYGTINVNQHCKKKKRKKKKKGVTLGYSIVVHIARLVIILRKIDYTARKNQN